MVRVEFIVKTGLVCLLGCLGATGCGSGAQGKKQTTAYLRLKAIGKAYGHATESLDHPPNNKAEIMEFLKNLSDPDNPDNSAWDPAEILRSPTDGEEFVIHWGVDIREYDARALPKKLPVLAYEKHGKEGKRYVLQIRFPREVTDEEFANLPFPKGFRALE